MARHSLALKSGAKLAPSLILFFRQGQHNFVYKLDYELMSHLLNDDNDEAGGN